MFNILKICSQDYQRGPRVRVPINEVHNWFTDALSGLVVASWAFLVIVEVYQRK